MNKGISDDFFKNVKSSFKLYKDCRRELSEKIIENNRWFKSIQSEQSDDNMPIPSTGFLFNAIANKHADAMDNYPEPNILERTPEDSEEAKILTQIIPAQLEMNNFKHTYSRAWWYKLKNGAAAYGVFFNNKLNGGIGDIDITHIDLLNLYWEPYITDIQQSQYLFITAFDTKENLSRLYPDKKNQLEAEKDNDTTEIYSYNPSLSSEVYKDKLLVIDCYYKKPNPDGTTAVHLLKYCGDTVLSCSEEQDGEGLYRHGMYPVVIDPLFPDADSPVGFGIIDIVKNPQRYIDKLDYIISKNALMSGKIRYLIKDNGGVNENELADMGKDIIHVAGSVDDTNIRQFQTAPLDAFIFQHRIQKISELKEIAGNRDFQQGGTTGGVTAYGAIVALQQAGEKISRDMINEGYEAYRKIVYMMIELIRQFFTEPRSYRIDNGVDREYITYSNSNLEMQPLGQLFDGDDTVYRRPEFDVAVIPQKHNPYNKVSQNQLAIELYGLGIFNPDNIDQSLMMLELMQFDGKEKIAGKLKNIKESMTALSGLAPTQP